MTIESLLNILGELCVEFVDDLEIDNSDHRILIYMVDSGELYMSLNLGQPKFYTRECEGYLRYEGVHIGEDNNKKVIESLFKSYR